jgi:hypothetical protein
MLDWKSIIENFKIKTDEINNKKYFIFKDKIFYKKILSPTNIEVGHYLINVGWNEGKLDGTTKFSTFTDDGSAEMAFIKILNREMKNIEK